MEFALRGEIFDDFLSMAEHLLEEGYKDPSAVVAGSTLESHLRRLCLINNIPITVPTPKGTSQPKKASQMNDDLYKAGVYGGTEQKYIAAWLSIRNSAAHGQYTQYTDKEVELFLSGIRNFVERYPT